jgi:hypothetical protein
MSYWDRFKNLRPAGLDYNKSLNLMLKRAGTIDLPKYRPDTIDGANDMAKKLIVHGGFP